MAELLGYVDTIREKEVIGWAKWSQSDAPAQVCLLINEKITASQQAQLFRKDVKDQALHHSGCCGFHFKLPKGLLDGQQVRVAGMCKDQLIPLHGNPEPRRFIKKRKIFLMHIPKTAGYSIND